MALSATIGNPNKVTDWLQSVKRLQQQQDQQSGTEGPAASYQVNLIQHKNRYADLRYHRYNQSTASGQEDPTIDQVLRRLHPCAVLDAPQLQRNGFPPQISLEPSDCLELYQAMVSVVQWQFERFGCSAMEAAYAAQDVDNLNGLLQAALEAEIHVAAPKPHVGAPAHIGKQAVAMCRTQLEMCRSQLHNTHLLRVATGWRHQDWPFHAVQAAIKACHVSPALWHHPHKFVW